MLDIVSSKASDHLVILSIVVLSIPVGSIQAAAGHGSHVVWMGQATHFLCSDTVGSMRIESPLQILITKTVLNNRRSQSISHTHSLVLPILASSILIPIPRN